MATTFDRVEFVRALRGKPGMSDEAVEAMADALHKQHDAADYVTRKDLDTALSRLESSLKLWTAGIAAVLAAFLGAIKFFG